jgi:hypothetical protein
MAVRFSALDVAQLEDASFDNFFREEVTASVAAAAGVHRKYVIITDILEGSVKVRLCAIRAPPWLPPQLVAGGEGGGGSQ